LILNQDIKQIEVVQGYVEGYAFKNFIFNKNKRSIYCVFLLTFFQMVGKYTSESFLSLASYG